MYQSSDGSLTSNGNLTSKGPSKGTSKYDNKGKLIEMKNYESDGNLSITTLFKYDEKGNEIEKKLLRANGVNSKDGTKYEYDIKGNWIKKIDFYNEIPQSITIRDIEYYTE